MSLDKTGRIQEGDTLGPFEYTVGAEMADLHLAAVDNTEAEFRNALPDGRRRVPPCFTGRDYVYLFLQKGIWGGGGIQTAHESEFYRPLHVGQRVVCTGAVTETYERKGRDYMVLECRLDDCDGTPLAKHRLTFQVFSGKEPRG